MRITLEDLRLYFADRKSDALSALGVSGFAVFLLLLSRLADNQVLALVAFVNFAFLWVPLGSLWQKRRLREKWRQQGLDSELMRHCEKLCDIDWSLDEHVDAVLSVYTTINELARHSAWYAYDDVLDEHLGSVREGLVAFFQRVLRVDELRRLYDRCAESLRRPERLAALQARVDREYHRLERFADAFERALLDFSEAMAAAMGSNDESAMTDQLSDFAAGMRRLAQSIDDAGGVEDLLGDLDDEAAFERLLADEPAPRMAADEAQDAWLVDDEEREPGASASDSSSH